MTDNDRTCPPARPAFRPHRMLFSYHYAKRLDITEFLTVKLSHRPVVFADSGAYSALSLGTEIDIGAYSEWLHENGHLFEVYANLDSIESAAKSLSNQQEMERRGLRPIPVYHTGEPWKYFDQYIAEHPYVALGGAVGHPQSSLMPWLVECFRRRNEAGSPAQFHGFGMTGSRTIKAFPWYSVDSSSWGSGYRFGHLLLFDPVRSKMTKVQFFTKDVLRYAKLIRSYGGDPGHFLNRKNYHHSHAAYLGARSWRALEDWLRQRHGPVELSERDAGGHIYFVHTGGDLTNPARRDAPLRASEDRAGPHLYLADAVVSQHVHANRALND